MDCCNIVNTLVEMGLKLTKDGEGRVIELSLYKSLVGSLMYLAITRPDIVMVLYL